MNLRLPSFWSGMGYTAKAGYLCSTHQARNYEEACQILRGLRRPSIRKHKYPRPDPVEEMERRKLW